MGEFLGGGWVGYVFMHQPKGHGPGSHATILIGYLLAFTTLLPIPLAGRGAFAIEFES